jgi:hypothetical protein
LFIELFRSARELPPEWDDLCGDNLYLTREFQQFIESIDACEQTYCIFRNSADAIDTILMTYVRHNFNLFMFTPVHVSLRVTFVYVPLSVTRPGIICRGETREELAAHIKGIKGYKLFLNTATDFRLPGFIQVRTFPRCVLDLRWNSFDHYMRDLRSGYRHRYKKALAKSTPLTFRMLDDNRQFDHRLYALYEEVYKSSPYKIEKLPVGFFQGPFFKIGILEKGSVAVGFIQLIENGPELIFEFVGFDHRINSQYDIYISLLLKIVQYGIEHRFERIDFGQTADEAKLKIGCRYEPLFGLLHHSNPLVHNFTGAFVRRIEYKPLDEQKFHVFKPALPRLVTQETSAQWA